MTLGVVVAARMGSTRLPGKVLLPFQNLPMIVFLLRRLSSSQEIDSLVLATTDLKEDDQLAQIVAQAGFEVFRGHSSDLVQRYLDVADQYSLDTIVRVTGDCPFTSAQTLDYCLKQCSDLENFDLITTKRNFPVGIDYEIFKVSTIRSLHLSGDLSTQDREHLTLHIDQNHNCFRVHQLSPLESWRFDEFPFTVDTQDDYKRLSQLASSFDSWDFSVDELIEKAKDLKIESWQ